MPHFFFDTDDGSQHFTDKEGHELENGAAAKAMAQVALAEMVRDALPDGDRRTFTVGVRDESGQVVVSTALSLITEYSSQASK
ncbi:DUF6894 family protein [Microvirga sp. P5_D2]